MSSGPNVVGGNEQYDSGSCLVSPLNNLVGIIARNHSKQKKVWKWSTTYMDGKGWRHKGVERVSEMNGSTI